MNKLLSFKKKRKDQGRMRGKEQPGRREKGGTSRVMRGEEK